ncbi:MAG TPA: VOC family protein [Tepidisphaeraceae bacterium]|jgi:catechol 2,3-dioxygenase-like lactoylglutathione lyase family enzyme|nr:VOC family protein [Tepidisphaeraceae bacterium]
MFISLDHPAIACFDVQKQADWYCRNFGMRVIAGNGENPPAMVIGYGDSLLGGAMIELMPVKDPGADPASIARFAPGIRHLCLRVSNFDAAYAKLKEIGVVFTTEPGQAVGSGKTILFRDPEGNELQIVERT